MGVNEVAVNPVSQRKKKRVGSCQATSDIIVNEGYKYTCGNKFACLWDGGEVRHLLREKSYAGLYIIRFMLSMPPVASTEG